MKKTVLTILFLGVLLLGMTGCESKVENSKKELDEEKENLEKLMKNMDGLIKKM